jgi:medium-chain acyl-[acyl-carrier-protein] hydrolase
MEKLETSYRVRSYETGVRNRLTLPNLCNYLQEAAGDHAEALGFGILDLQSHGLSWMLSRLRVKVLREAAWGAKLKVLTWPCGVARHIIAPRDYQVFDAETGEQIAEGASEWFVVDLAALRVARPPEAFMAVVGEGLPHVSLASEPGRGKFAALAKVDASAKILVRRADHDFNDHVNNVHYVEWAFEALPDAFRNRVATGLDIVFRQAAHAGDELESRVEIVDDSHVRVAIVRLSDNVLLATAALDLVE